VEETIVVDLPGDEDYIPPALFDHCCKTYNAMFREARPIEHTVPVSDDGPMDGVDVKTVSVMVYEGFLTQLITGKLTLSVPYYTKITQKLIQMGCIRQMKRGGGTAPSQWELVYEPTVEAFMRATPRPVPKQTKEDQTNRLILGLTKRITTLEDQVQSLIEAAAQAHGAEPTEEPQGEKEPA
jgi:hypothetical protein